MRLCITYVLFFHENIRVAWMGNILSLYKVIENNFRTHAFDYVEITITP